jgi:hypothetical protein
MTNEETKTIFFTNVTKTKMKGMEETNVKKIPKTREFILQHVQLSEHVIPFDQQWNFLLQLSSELEETKKEQEIVDVEKEKICKYIKQEIKKKITSYRSQDFKKQVYDETNFIDYPFLIKKMIETHMKCFYCQCNLFIFYDQVREKYQWTMDRIDNQKGHVKDNFVLSCFACNIKRRCQQLEKFHFTKTFVLTKVIM